MFSASRLEVSWEAMETPSVFAKQESLHPKGHSGKKWEGWGRRQGSFCVLSRSKQGKLKHPMKEGQSEKRPKTNINLVPTAFFPQPQLHVL